MSATTATITPTVTTTIDTTTPTTMAPDTTGEGERLSEIVYSSISEVEKTNLKALVSRLQDISENALNARFVHPFTIIRFLRARQGDVDKAEFMFRNSMKWREEERIDARVAEWTKEFEAQKTSRSQLIKKYGWTSIGPWQDLRGLPVSYNRVGAGDPSGIEREVGWDTFLIHHAMEIEGCFAMARAVTLAKGKYLNSFVTIVDLHHGDVPKFTARAWASLPAMKKIAPVLDNMYPERIHRSLVVNVPRMFCMIWAIFTPIIPKETAAKISLHSSGWEDILYEFTHEAPKGCLKHPDKVENEEELNAAMGGIVQKGALQKEFNGTQAPQ